MNIKLLPRWKKGGERGQSLVEMTIGSIVLLTLAFGLLDLGRLYFIFIALEDGAGEAALYAAINPACRCRYGDPELADFVCHVSVAADQPGCSNPNNALWRAQNSGGTDGGGSVINWENAVVIIEYIPEQKTVGTTVDVRIEYEFKLLTPLIPSIANADTLTLTAHAAEIILVRGSS